MGVVVNLVTLFTYASNFLPEVKYTAKLTTGNKLRAPWNHCLTALHPLVHEDVGIAEGKGRLTTHYFKMSFSKFKKCGYPLNKSSYQILYLIDDF